MTPLRACVLVLLVLVLWFELTMLAGCAAKVPPVPAWVPPITIDETEPSHRLVCVRAAPFLDTSLECLTVGDFRRLMRSRRRL